MAPHVRNERARLLRREAQILDAFAKLDPILAGEYRDVRAALKAIDTPADARYATIRSTKAAVHACLEHEKRWIAKREIADLLFRGGFIMDPEHGQRLVVDSINHNVQRGNFRESDGLIGLLDWELK